MVALVVTIIVMLILASVTISASFTAYENTRVEKFKAIMKLCHEGSNSLYVDYLNWLNEKKYEYKELVNEWNSLNELYNTSDGATKSEALNARNNISIYQLPDLDEDGNIPASEMISYSMDVFLNEKDAREATDPNKYDTSDSDRAEKFINLPVSNEIKSNVRSKIKDAVGIEPNDLNELYFYRFEENDFKYIFGLRNIDTVVYINFDNQLLFTSNGVKMDGEMVYSLYSFKDMQNIYKFDTTSTIIGAKIRIDEIANYGISKKIKLTLNTSHVVNQDNSQVSYKIRKAYYKTDLNKVWREVDDLNECVYSTDGNSVTFIVDETGYYNFKIEDMSGSKTETMERFTKFNVKNSSTSDDTNYDVINRVLGYEVILSNAPVLNDDMVPVKWVYEDSNRKDGKWVICSNIDPEWYNYGPDYKMWANIMFKTDMKTSRTLHVGDELAEYEIGSMFVWIPRYAMCWDSDDTLLTRWFFRG